MVRPARLAYLQRIVRNLSTFPVVHLFLNIYFILSGNETIALPVGYTTFS